MMDDVKDAASSTQEGDTRACPMCAETIKAAALKCKHCGSVVDAAEGAKVSDRVKAPSDDQRGEPTSEASTYAVEGVNGQIRLTRKRVIIARSGVRAFLTQGLAGDREIPFASITAVQFKEAGGGISGVVSVNGFLKLTVMGGVDGRGGIRAAVRDENTVMFSTKQQPHFQEVKRYIDSVIDGSPVAFESLALPKAGAPPPAVPPKASEPAVPSDIDVTCPTCSKPNRIYPKALSGAATCSSCGARIEREVWEAPTGASSAPVAPLRQGRVPEAPPAFALTDKPLENTLAGIASAPGEGTQIAREGGLENTLAGAGSPSSVAVASASTPPAPQPPPKILTEAERASLAAETAKKKQAQTKMRTVGAAVLVGACALCAILGAVLPKPKPQDTSPGGGSGTSQVVGGNGAHARSGEPIDCAETFPEFNIKFGLQSRLTDIQKDDEFKKYRGKRVRWLGRVVDVQRGFAGGVKLGVKIMGRTLTFDVLLTPRSSDEAKAAALSKGQTVVFTGRLVDRGGLLPVQLEDGTIEPTDSVPAPQEDPEKAARDAVDEAEAARARKAQDAADAEAEKARQKADEDARLAKIEQRRRDPERTYRDALNSLVAGQLEEGYQLLEYVESGQPALYAALWRAGLSGNTGSLSALADATDKRAATLARVYLGTLSEQQALAEAAKERGTLAKRERLCELHVHLGLLCELKGDRDGARQQYQAATADNLAGRGVGHEWARARLARFAENSSEPKPSADASGRVKIRW